jgi:hypothetical protein
MTFYFTYTPTVKKGCSMLRHKMIIALTLLSVTSVSAQAAIVTADEWWSQDDYFGGFRHNEDLPTQVFARTNDVNWDWNTDTLEIMDGYHWATQAEHNALFEAAPQHGSDYYYYGRGDWNGYNDSEGKYRTYLVFADSSETGGYLNVANQMSFKGNTGGWNPDLHENVAGLVLIKDEVIPEPAPVVDDSDNFVTTEEWWSQDDYFGGFRHNEDLSTEVFARTNDVNWDWNTDTLEIMDGYHWATQAEHDALFELAPQHGSDYYYYGRGDWNGYNDSEGKYRTYLVFADSSETGGYLNVANQMSFKGNTGGWNPDLHENVAGLVLIKDLPPGESAAPAFSVAAPSTGLLFSLGLIGLVLRRRAKK